MFPEVLIDAKIMCTVTFWNDEEEFDTQFIERGREATTPEIPARASTPQYYYTFNSWDTPYNVVMSDLDIHAVYDSHIQVYHVIYDTRSDVINVDPEYNDLLYGSLIPEPTIDESTIPSGVRFLGWYTANNDIVDFTTKTVSGDILNFPASMNISLAARWQDENVPVVTLTRVAFNKFAFRATDNMGVTGWLVKDSEEVSLTDDTWTDIVPTTLFEGEYTINAAGDYYFHVKDDQGNTSWAKIHADAISLNPNIHNERDTFVNQIQLQLTENNETVTDFALLGTTISVRATNDNHYQNLVLSYNGIILSQGDEVLIEGTTVINGSVYPKSYTVNFNMNRKGDPVTNQSIPYKHLVIEPDPQLYQGDALTAWLTDSGQIWQFMEDEIVEDTQLNARWDAVTVPTYINVSIPENNFTLTLNFSQTDFNGLEIDWGDGATPERINNYGQLSVNHIYAEQGPKTIALSRKVGTYLLGYNYDTPAIQPITAVTDINFSYDVPYTRAGAFRGATQLTSIHLTRFMTRISSSTFEGCINATTFKVSGRENGEDVTIITDEIPNSIKQIYERAFQGCIGLTSIRLPSKLMLFGSYAFDGCTNLETVIFNSQCPLTTIASYAFNNCSALADVRFSSSLTAINERAFQGCSSLTNIVLGPSIVSLGDAVFLNCVGLESITFQAPSMSFGSLCLQGCPHLTTAGPIGGDYAIQFA